jgi:hypothetical protein
MMEYRTSSRPACEKQISTVMGYSDPKYYLGWTNKFTYKNFDLSLSVDGRVGDCCIHGLNKHVEFWSPSR